MSLGLADRWIAEARAAAAWRDGQPIAPVLEVLALAVALETTGELSETPPALRDELRRIGQRALLQAGGLDTGGGEGSEDEARIVLGHARDGLRALSGRAPERDDTHRRVPLRGTPPAGDTVPARDIARLLGGRIDALEAASIARRVRASEQARRELAWAIRLRRAEPASVRLAAADGGSMRDPGAGRAVATIADPETGAPVAEVFAFETGSIAIYAQSDEVVRLEGPGVRTETMQAGYWAGRADGPIEGVLYVGERSIAVRLALG